MKAVPLWQPWATLIALGEKRVETRSWPPPIAVVGERVAIHATKGGLSKSDERDILELDHFQAAFGRHGWPDDVWEIQDLLPRGAIVATARVARATRITDKSAAALRERNLAEYAFGNYEPGRWAWVLEDVEQLPEPIAATGHQGIFDLPREIARQVSSEPDQLTLDDEEAAA